ncbi:hypothetical protein ND748_31495, partial [Frankia sp. AiPs1]|nr:hypothetical protein [Frankia sp. AiPs1]
RLAVQAGVAAHLATADGQLAGLHRRIAALLRTCGEPGVLAGPPPPGDVAALTTRLTTWLLGRDDFLSAAADLSAGTDSSAGADLSGGAEMKVR